MYTHKKPHREDFHTKSRKNQENNMPSFSSSLLDEIYRSIDGNADKKTHDGGAASFRRACLVENWMKLDEREIFASKRRESLMQENDFMFFSTTSCSSDSSGALSSSDTEFFGSTESRTRPKVSCFSAKPKAVRTGDDLDRMKSRALKMYAGLKRVKQPISPGGRLTSFLNSLFSNAKSKNVEKNKKGVKSPDCPPSASSFSRSCLSKYSPASREKMRNGAQRTVRFNPVSVIVDQDSRPCGRKCTYDEEFVKTSQLSMAAAKGKMEKSRKVEEVGCNKKPFEEFSIYRKKSIEEFSIYRKILKREEEDENNDDDCLSDASSDLFELDHLALFGDKRFCEELPVYETTHVATNRAIASGLVR